MPDFRALVRAQVTPLHLSSEREETVVEEYALYIEDVYASLLHEGFSADAAWDESQRRIPSWAEWRQQLLAADPNSRAVVGALARSATTDRARAGERAPRLASVVATLALLPLAIGRDLTVAMRALGRNRGPVLAAMASVGIAVGVAGAAASVTAALYAWRPAVVLPDRLVFVSRADASRHDDHQLTLDEFQELRRNARHVGVLGGVLGWRDVVRTIRAREHTSTAMVAEVDGDFDELGLQPVIGRGFRADELRPADGNAATPPVALLSYQCWRERFASDPSVLGERLIVDGVAVTIVGVTPPAFTGLSVEIATSAIVPLAFNAGRPGYRRRDTDVTTLARLGPTASVAQAAAQLQALWPQVFSAVGRGRNAAGSHSQPPTVVVASARYGITDTGVGLRRSLGGPLRSLIALGIAAVLVAYINLAGLMLARAAARRPELELRIALGASRWGAARPLTLEGMLIGLGGGAIALGLMCWLTPVLVVGLVGERVLTVPLLTARPPLALTAAAFAAACIAAACSALPGFRLARFGQLAHLRGMSSRIRGEGVVLQRVLVVAQLGFAVVFCAAAIFFTRELYRLSAAHLPFRVADTIALQTFPLTGDGSRIPDGAAYFRRVVERFAQVPGVLDTTFSVGEPLAGRNSGDAGASVVVGGAPRAAQAALVGPEFFRVMGISMLSGREFTWRDDKTATPAVVVNAAFRDVFLRDADALGSVLSIPEFFYPLPDRLQVIGVASDAGLWDVRHPTVPTVYLPLLQSPVDAPFVILHTRPSQAPSPQVLNHTLESLGHHFSLRTETLSAARDRALQMERLSAVLAMLLCSLNILLATMGVYALVAYAVQRRTSEMGVRLALGATSSSIITLVMREALILAAIGICIGTPVAMAVVTAGARLLLGDAATYPPAYVLSAAIVLGVAAIASSGPAWRAAKLSPSIALSSS